MDRIDNIFNEKIVFQLGKRCFEISLYELIMPVSGFSILYYLFWKNSEFDSTELKKPTPQLVTEKNSDDVPYEPMVVKIPIVKGWVINFYRKLCRTNAFGKFLLNSSKSQGDLDMFLTLSLPDPPTFYPSIRPDVQSEIEEKIDLESFIKPSDAGEDFHFNTISDYYTAYRKGTITPLQVAENVLHAIDDTDKKGMKIMIGLTESHRDDILKHAEESTKRWNLNQQLSVFDGVPVAVKDEIFLAGYPCRKGFTTNVGGSHVITEAEEGWMVRKLREGGAIFIGVTNMHQNGMGVTGINTSSSHGTCRNPHNTNFPCGGSSSGSAAAVSAGLCPIALGKDGGGSIRIPSSVCGLVGAKNTFGRISNSGAAAGTSTIGHPGPLCASVQDACIAYGFLAGRDEADESTLVQPLPTLSEKELSKGITIGIDWNFFNDCSAEIVQSCKAAVNYLSENYGATIVDISIPEIQESSRAHIVTIIAEMYSFGQEYFEKYHDEINADTEILLRYGKHFSAQEYFRAQQQRTRCINIFKRLFKSVDCIITPTCGEFMPKLDASILKNGLIDQVRATSVMRFMPMGNLAGNPSISIPVGYSIDDNLPIGLCIHTGWWKEELMLQIADAVKNHLKLQRPQVYYDVLHA